ncbi:hypothetical protein KIPE111705_32485 [Kibdelosporangium persicum]
MIVHTGTSTLPGARGLPPENLPKYYARFDLARLATKMVFGTDWPGTLCADVNARPYRSETERREALPRWLHTYNHYRGHTALGGHPPASRVPTSQVSTPRSCFECPGR